MRTRLAAIPARLRLAAALALVLAACAARADETPVDPATIHDAAACAALGGQWLERVRLCVIAYADGGKACTDDTDCEGKCLADTRVPPPASGPETGACAKDSNLLGCKAEILNGVRQQVICRD